MPEAFCCGDESLNTKKMSAFIVDTAIGDRHGSERVDDSLGFTGGTNLSARTSKKSGVTIRRMTHTRPSIQFGRTKHKTGLLAEDTPTE